MIESFARAAGFLAYLVITLKCCVNRRLILCCYPEHSEGSGSSRPRQKTRFLVALLLGMTDDRKE